jgi:hypothetical protein
MTAELPGVRGAVLSPDLNPTLDTAAGSRSGAGYLVTRDRACYAAGPLPTLTPGESLALLVT